MRCPEAQQFLQGLLVEGRVRPGEYHRGVTGDRDDLIGGRAWTTDQPRPGRLEDRLLYCEIGPPSSEYRDRRTTCHDAAR